MHTGKARIGLQGNSTVRDAYARFKKDRSLDNAAELLAVAKRAAARSHLPNVGGAAPPTSKAEAK
jgi:hypothetical protein